MKESVTIQLMVSNGELGKFGESGILAKLDAVDSLLQYGRVFLSVEDPASDFSRKLVGRFHDRGASVALWTMVLADTGRPDLPPAQDFSGNQWHGSLGAWNGYSSAGNEFSFRCPTAVMLDGRGPELALATLRSSGADALFLDRIRYPAPSNGLEFLGACACPACKARYIKETGEDMPDLAWLAVKCAKLGFRGASLFFSEARTALEFREKTIQRVVERYQAAAHAESAELGLDLFAPVLSGFVGVNWSKLGERADFIKGMFYCKTRGPACLPLELSCHARGLVESGVPLDSAVDYCSALTGIADEEIKTSAAGGLIASAIAGGQYRLAKSMLPASKQAQLFAGIELVQYEGFGVDSAGRDAYLEALAGDSGKRAPVAVCWNVMYVPDGHLAAIAEAYSG